MDDHKAGPRVVDLVPPDKMKAAADEVLRNLPTLIGYADHIAKIRRANYLALVKEGFTEAQALDLCWRV